MFFAQLKCCGVQDLSDYGNHTGGNWEPRNESALAPLSCCSGLKSESNEFPPTSVDPDRVLCVLIGNDTNAYNKHVRFVALTCDFYSLQPNLHISAFQPYSNQTSFIERNRHI